MKSSKTRKILSIILAVLMLVSSVPANVFAAEESYPVMMATNAASSKGYYRYYNKIYSITFLDEIKIEGEPLEQWDMSSAGDGSVWGWMYLNEEATATAGDKRYDVYVAGEGGISVHPNSTHLFYMFENLTTVNNPENLKTSDVTSFKLMFSKCYDLISVDLSSWDTSNVKSMNGIFDMSANNGAVSALESVDLTGWDTSNVTDMSYMFYNCSNLDNLDLSSFNTEKVTNMSNMFYRCMDLENIYIGDGWTVESVNSANAMFNCCYAIVGGKDIYDKDFQYIPPGKEYAKTKEEGGFLTYKAPEAPEEYRVTYKFIGDIIPEGVTAPDAATYEEGTTVTVADNASAEHYIFSGWTTEDAEVVNGEFVINNDVEFVGSWTKLYKVEYKYDDNYKLPPDYPEIPDVELWYAPGEDVPVYGIPYAPDHIFVGWNTGDAEIIGDSFLMPENDVVLYGYYKIPVNSIEIEGGDLTIDIGGEKVKVEVYVDPPEATFDGVEFESGDESIVKVDKDGNLEPVGVGTTTITITSKDDPTKTDTVNVTVKIPVTDIIVDRNVIDLNKGDTDKITVTEVKPAEATNKDVTYESSDETVVKVDENGNIIAVGDGTATITVVSKDNKTAKKTVTVTVKTPVTEITATEDFTLKLEETKNVEAKVNEDATEKGIIYETSDPGVVKIDNDGNVVAVGKGTAVITVTSKDNKEISETITVTVIGEYKVSYRYEGYVPEDAVNQLPEEKIYDEGTTVKVADDPVTSKNYAFSGWSTDDATVVDGEFVINNDVEFVGSWERTYNVYYTITNAEEVGYNEIPASQSYKAGTTVTVADLPELEGYVFVGWETKQAEIVNNEFTMPGGDVLLSGYFKRPVSGVEIQGNEEITLEKNDETTIKVTVTPDDATDKNVTFTSSDETVVKVDENGKITALKDGTVTITVRSEDDPEKYDTITVTVLKEHEVTYEFIGEVIPEGVTAPEAKLYSDGKTVFVEKNASADGYIFSGWSTDDVAVNDGRFVIDRNVHFTGSWTKINYYDVTYVVDGNAPEGYKVPDAKRYEEGSYVSVETVPYAKGYRFSGWTSEDADITSGGFSINNDVVISGTWTKLYNVSYKYEGDVPEGYTPPEKATYDEGTAVDVAEEPYKEGYIFEGWTANTDITDGKVVADKDVVITGKWTKLYNVSYEYIGEVPENAPALPAIAEYKAGTAVAVEAVPVVEGYTFHGWTTEDAAVKDNGFEMPSKDVKLYGYFTKNVTDITVNRNEFELEVDGEDNIIVTVTPDDATDKEVTFTSSDEAVVKVDENGKITAVGEGEATITVTSKENPSIKEEIKVTVKAPEEPEEPEVPEEPEKIPVTDITVSKNEFELEIGDEDEITVTVTPDDATDKEVTFTSSDEAVVKVDENGKITAVGEGDATITVTSKENPSIKEEIKVTVKAPEEPEEPDYTIEAPDGLNVYIGETINVGISIVPDDGKLKPTYKSSDESIVTVDAEGNITGISEGPAIITASFGNGEIITIPVMVIAPAPIPTKHHIVFGKTDGIGWYEVSVNGGDFFPQGPNSTLEVNEGDILVVRVQDMWIDDEFDFYVNGKKVPMDPANTITVVVDGYMLIGALSMDVEVPDVEESVSLLDKIKNFFLEIINWFKNLFK